MIGKMRDRITIESKTQTPDGIGGFSEEWSAFAEVWAEVLPTSARERMFADKLEGNITHKIRIRFLAGVDTHMRVQHKGQTLKLVGPPINEEGRSRFLILTCEEGSGS